jgi:hypothetical protein
MSPEQIDALREELANRANRKSNRAPAQAPSQTFGMRTHSSSNVGRRPRYDPEAAASARYNHNLELMDLRKKVEADNEERATKQREKVQAAHDRNDGNHPAGGYPAMLLGNTERDSTDPLLRTAYWKERGINSAGLSPEERAKVQGPTARVQLPVGDRPISSMYSVTPNQYQAAYHIPFAGSDPDSMRRLLALQNGTASVIESERSVLDQRSQDAYNSRPANPNPTTAAYTGLAPMSTEQMRVGVRNNIQSPEDRKVMENAERVGGITPESIDAYDRREKMKLDREGPRPEFNPMVKVKRQIENERNKPAMDPLAQSILDELNGISTTLEPSDTPSATYGPGRKGLPRGAVPRK